MVDKLNQNAKLEQTTSIPIYKFFSKNITTNNVFIKHVTKYLKKLKKT